MNIQTAVFLQPKPLLIKKMSDKKLQMAPVGNKNPIWMGKIMDTTTTSSKGVPFFFSYFAKQPIKLISCTPGLHCRFNMLSLPKNWRQGLTSANGTRHNANNWGHRCTAMAPTLTNGLPWKGSHRLLKSRLFWWTPWDLILEILCTTLYR